MSYSKEDLAGLTPDEQDALLSEQQPEVDALAAIAAETDTVDEAAAPVVVADEVVAPAESETEEAAQIQEFQPEFKATAPEGIADTLAALKTQAEELKAKFKEGEIDLPDYLDAKESIDEQLTQARLADAQSKWASEQNAATREQRWQWEKERFFSQKAAELYNDPILIATLDATIKNLAAAPDNANRPAGWFLEEADRQVRQRFGGTQGAKLEVAPPAPKPAEPTLRTIGGLPAAAPAPIGDDIMAKIGSLEGEELERYFARLSPADVEKLSRAAS